MALKVNGMMDMYGVQQLLKTVIHYECGITVPMATCTTLPQVKLDMHGRWMVLNGTGILIILFCQLPSDWEVRLGWGILSL